MWVVACFVRGMSVDEALKQLASARRKGAAIVTKAIEEAVEMAVKDHNVEFRSNLWIGTYGNLYDNVILKEKVSETYLFPISGN